MSNPKNGPERGYKWWLRYIVFGSGGLIALIIAFVELSASDSTSLEPEEPITPLVVANDTNDRGKYREGISREQTQNYILNPDFSDGVTYWSRATPNVCLSVKQVDETNILVIQSSAKDPDTVSVLQDLRIPAGTYTMTAWVRVGDDLTQRVSLRLGEGRSDKELGSTSNRTIQGSQWVRLQVKGTKTQQNSKLRAEIYLHERVPLQVGYVHLKKDS